MNQTSDTLILPNERLAAAPDADAGRGYEAGYHVVVLLLCVGPLVGSFLLRPEEDGLSLLGYRWPFHCRLYETFGVKCALCGMSRAFCSIAHGDIAPSFAFHPLGPAVFALFCLEVLYRVYAMAGRWKTRRFALKGVHAGAIALVALAVLVNWLLYLGGLVL